MYTLRRPQILVSRFCRLHLTESRRCVQNDSAKDDAVELDTSFDDAERNAYIERQRNKSRLTAHHRNMLFDRVPYSKPHMWYHETEKYSRRMLGRYGTVSGVNPSICWPNKGDLSDMKEYESVAYPFSLQELMEKSENEIKAKEEAIARREEEISRKMEQLEMWKNQLHAKIAKKEAEAEAAKARKDRLVEEVRRHFGFKIDPRDERFKEMLQQKEKEEKKLLKAAKRKAREERELARLTGVVNEVTEQTKTDP